MFAIAGQCIFICQCHHPNLYITETGLLAGQCEREAE